MRPIYDMLRERRGDLRLHMPGHGGIPPFGEEEMYAMDTTETEDTDDLYHPRSGILAAEKAYALSAGAACTLMLHNGSTQGIHAMLQMWTVPGDTVILPRNAHLSAASAAVLGGLRVVWIPVRRADGYVRIAEEDVIRCIRDCPEARVLLITRPDYFGMCLPLERIREETAKRGIHLAVDEAHGAHLPWDDEIPGAHRSGADAWTQSCHKTLPALTGSAVLNLRHEEDRAGAMRVLRREMTSSPSFLLLLSVDDAREWMDRYGRDSIEKRKRILRGLEERIREMGYRDPRDAWARESGQTVDRTRLVLRHPRGGFALHAHLRSRGIQAEMADREQVCLLTSVFFGEREAGRLEDALRDMPVGPVPEEEDLPLPEMPRTAMDLREAAMGPVDMVPLSLAEGRVCAACVGVYPPGIPLAVPGEYLESGLLEYLKRTPVERRFGMEGERIPCVGM